ncbi:hypothetical protein MAUB1S_10358 [Mycolicibacterium aubagnense]
MAPAALLLPAAGAISEREFRPLRLAKEILSEPTSSPAMTNRSASSSSLRPTTETVPAAFLLPAAGIVSEREFRLLRLAKEILSEPTSSPAMTNRSASSSSLRPTTETVPAAFLLPAAGIVSEREFRLLRLAKEILSKPTSSRATTNKTDLLLLLPEVGHPNDTRRTSSPGGCCVFRVLQPSRHHENCIRTAEGLLRAA